MYVTDLTEEKTPKFYCKSCSKCTDKHCSFFNRRVEKHNRCFNHSNYHTVTTKYQSPENIAEIAELNHLKEVVNA